MDAFPNQNNKNHMKLKEYIDIMIPMVLLLENEKRVNPKAYKSRQLWYIYRQYFYGFAEFIDWNTLINASKDAQALFISHCPNLSLLDQHWRHKGRKLYNLDHIYIQVRCSEMRFQS